MGGFDCIRCSCYSGTFVLLDMCAAIYYLCISDSSPLCITFCNKLLASSWKYTVSAFLVDLFLYSYQTLKNYRRIKGLKPLISNSDIVITKLS